VTECLAFANVPEPITLEPWGVPAVHHPRWKAGVPRDRGASWDFEDTRDHYLERVFGLHPAQLRRTDPAHYLAASRAVVAHVIGHTLAEWRRPASPTRGALVFTAADLQMGAGWGLIDVQGEPKSAYYAFAQVAQPVALFVTDEGCDGLDIHVANDTPVAQRWVLHVRALRHGAVEVAKGELVVEVAAHAAITVPATRVLGVFLDVTYAYRFGEPGHDAVVVSAHQADATPHSPVLQACYFPQGPYAARAHVGLQAQVVHAAGEWWLELQCQTLARFVHIDDRTHRPQDNYFHLPPGAVRRVRLLPRAGAGGSAPTGLVTALNGHDPAHYRGLV
jgi:beta-mannosidase